MKTQEKNHSITLVVSSSEGGRDVFKKSTYLFGIFQKKKIIFPLSGMYGTMKGRSISLTLPDNQWRVFLEVQEGIKKTVIKLTDADFKFNKDYDWVKLIVRRNGFFTAFH